MKKLLIIRHAKSSWDLGILNDFDRTLNQRGHQDSPAMAKRLLDKNIVIDLFISSSATRAFTTASYFAKAYKKTDNDIVKIAELYHAMPPVFFETIAAIDNAFDTIAVFAHNPGITAFANQLTKTQIDDMPTCGIFAIEIDTDKWAKFAEAKKKFWFFDYPKLDS